MSKRRLAKSPISVTLIACPKCKTNAHVFHALPLAAGLKGEMHTYTCRRCGEQTKIIVGERAGGKV